MHSSKKGDSSLQRKSIVTSFIFEKVKILVHLKSDLEIRRVGSNSLIGSYKGVFPVSTTGARRTDTVILELYSGLALAKTAYAVVPCECPTNDTFLLPVVSMI